MSGPMQFKPVMFKGQLYMDMRINLHMYLSLSDFLLKKKAHVIMEGEKSSNLLSASWRPRKVSDIIWEPEGP